MRGTSLEAWRDIERGLPDKRVKVLNIIAKHPDGLALFEIVPIVGRPINEISGRVTELSKAGFIVEAGKRQNPDTMKQSTIWKLNPELVVKF